TEEQIKKFKDEPEEHARYCREIEGELNKRFNLMHLHSKDQQNSRGLIRDLMYEKLGHDDGLTKKMVPDFALGCRRMTPGSGYLESLR
ncbi:hypothetical protein, partial [Streptomyces albidoflavus]|uniref:hypothetical protein n=1 Tax=Streptomyces albidoflavus TaxID=1886 RepID=UPI0021D5ACCD